MKKLILASNNKHKQEEIQNILVDYEILLLRDINFYDDIPENADTFEGNALEKARAIYNFSNCPTIADDSGLCVDLLDNEPGVYSARYSGTRDDLDNINKVLEKLGNRQSSAKFVSVIAYVDSLGNEFTFRGEVHGEIIQELRGDNGFGYDPIFYVTEFNKTFAELSMEEKNSISHRKRALEQFVSYLEGN